MLVRVSGFVWLMYCELARFNCPKRFVRCGATVSRLFTEPPAFLAAGWRVVPWDFGSISAMDLVACTRFSPVFEPRTTRVIGLQHFPPTLIPRILRAAYDQPYCLGLVFLLRRLRHAIAAPQFFWILPPGPHSFLRWRFCELLCGCRLAGDDWNEWVLGPRAACQRSLYLWSQNDTKMKGGHMSTTESKHYNR